LKISIFAGLKFYKNIVMTTITLQYDARNPLVQKTLDYILSIGFFEVKPRKTGLQEAFEDIENGKVTRIYTPKNWKGGKV